MDILLFLIFVIVFLVALVVLIVFLIKRLLGPVKFNYKTYFLSGYVNYNNITKIERGECLLKFDKDKFFIIQNDKTIEDSIADIYNFRIWTFKGGLYLAISMKTSSEYKFSLIEPSKNNDMATAVIFKLFSKLAEKLKIELVESESGEPEDE